MQLTAILPKWDRGRRQILGIALFALFVFTLEFSNTVQIVATLRGVTYVLGLALLFLELFDRKVPRRRLLVLLAAVAAWSAVVVGIGLLAARIAHDPDYSMNIQKIFLIFPLFLVLGSLAIRSRFTADYCRVFVGLSLVVSVLLVVETLAGVTLLGRTADFLSFQRDGQLHPGLRAALGAVNPLVLSLQLTIAIPMFYRVKLLWRLVFSVVLIAGIWSTGSRASLAIAVVVAALQLVPLFVRLLQRLWVVLLAVAAVGLGVLFWFAAFVWTPVIPGGWSGADYSTYYRPAMYSFVPHMLQSAPLGQLLGSLPQGRYMMVSDLKGTIDLVNTVDSEIVYSIIQFGWIGLVLSLAAIFLSIAALRYSYPVGAVASILSCSGTFVALHAWDSLAPLWYLALGASAALILTRIHSRRRPVEQAID